MIDIFDVFAILALLCNEEVEPTLTFLFVFFGRNGSKQGGLDHKQFRDLIDRITSAVYKLLGNFPPDKKYSEMVVLNLYGKKGHMHREVMTLNEIWEWCQDEVEVANYLQKVFQFSLTSNSMYKQEVAVNTDSYLQNSKLMEGDSDDEDGSGIEKARPPLWNELVKGMATKAWWEDLPTVKGKDMNLCVLRQMWEKDKTAVCVFEGKKCQGIVDSMSLADKLVHAWDEVRIGNVGGGQHLAHSKILTLCLDLYLLSLTAGREEYRVHHPTTTTTETHPATKTQGERGGVAKQSQ